MALSRARETWCLHTARVPFYSCVYYLPPAAIIAELCRTRVWSLLPYTSPSGLVSALKEAENNRTSPLVSSNIADVLERWGFFSIASRMNDLLKNGAKKSNSEVLKSLIEAASANVGGFMCTQHPEASENQLRTETTADAALISALPQQSKEALGNTGLQD